MAEDSKTGGRAEETKDQSFKGASPPVSLEEKMRQLNAITRGGDFNPNLPQDEKSKKLSAANFGKGFFAAQKEAESTSMRVDIDK